MDQVVRFLIGLGSILFTALAVTSASADELRQPEQNPAIAHFADKILLYASLNGYPIADLSVGNGKPIGGVWKGPAWEPGIWGKALRSDAPAIRYDTRKHIRLEGSGSIAFWVQPQNWDATIEPTFISFLRVEAGSEQGFRQLQIIRMGESVNNRALAAYFQLGEASNTVRLGAFPSNSSSARWHLFVVNWTQSYLEASYDGGRMIRQTNPIGAPATSGDSSAYISIPGGGNARDFPYLIDEVFIFSKPLTNEEVLWLYQTAPQP